MAVKLNGTLVIKEIAGRNGKFCIGDLITPEGDFKVKESILDQFEEGRYEGEFVIERFYLSSYVWRGKSTTDIRAQVTDINLSEAIEGKQEDTQAEPDPIAIEPARPVAPVVSAEASTVPAPEQAQEALDLPVPAVVVEEGEYSPAYAELLELFGAELTALVWDGQSIKLDPTVDRAVFRQQRDRLKSLGYGFVATEQIWVKRAEQTDGNA